MKTEKLFYETPEALIVPLRPRRVMCQSPGAWDDAITRGTSWGDDDDYGLE